MDVKAPLQEPGFFCVGEKSTFQSEQHKLPTFFRISGGTAIGGGDPRQTVRPVEGAGTGGQSGARVGRGGGSVGCGNGGGGGGRRRPVTLLGRREDKRQLRGTV